MAVSYQRVSAYRGNCILYNFVKANAISGTVIMPANICTSVVDTLHYAGMDIRFLDIAPKSLCLDTAAALKLVQEASLLIYVHTYGVESIPDAFYAEVKQCNPKLFIVDDRCLCTPELDAKAHEQSLADLVLYSLGPKKFVVMDHGAVGFVSNRCRYEEIEEHSFFETIDYTFDEAVVELRREELRTYKQKLNDIYRELLPNAIQLPDIFQHWRFNIWVDNKTEIMQVLTENGLFASGHYKPLADYCPVAQDLYEHVINLFNDTYYTEEQARRTCEIINAKIKYAL